ncbi:ABC transporter ATP-binding protein [Pelagibacterium halotolerans]|uniref:ABC transporter, ATP-binding protein n=1 Tax=Pelagibacterium halotolerans (strain DSM 22347 / JCM 15775 / CGMCC 1.7692 / B2) TaxID=1082931 RepID=G4RB91_PELHB|nr:ATP-binding cassette domain-containing protein [Pelagibacterium halotolerans]AEQ51589.1 ABC transporter, ATP-binding protein [Pelagibacterium halotolerans B2]QJR18581.1 ATP-binding cassette domain-containing protein [Pelagibacterium halotolerans]SEA17636.1 energy-coupling factor transport system ATP-binding protein [Pelagibacterium halotolerans]
MSLAQWEGVSIRYPFATSDAVGPVDIAIGHGERVLVLGPSGSGKSLLMLALTGLIPNAVPASVAGRIKLNGADVASRSAAQWADTVAQYFQNADETLCGMRVGEEIAFALENRGMEPASIAARVADVLDRLGLPQEWQGRRSSALSGGERQLVALASVLAQATPILIADEPTSHLSPSATAKAHGLLSDRSAFEAVVVIDHRLEGLIDAIDRVVVLGENGSVLADMPPGPLFRERGTNLLGAGIWRPAFSALDDMLGAVGLASEQAPLSFSDVLAPFEPGVGNDAAIAAACVVAQRYIEQRISVPSAGGKVVASLRQADCAPPMGRAVLKDINLDIGEGEIVGLIGPNGAGKTTLAASLAGVLRLRAGHREGPMAGIAFQNPEAQLVAASVREEILGAIDGGGDCQAVLERWGLAGFAERHPFELSFGQKRRLALASLDARGHWSFVVFDEPFSGLDAAGAAMVAEHLSELKKNGKGVVLVSHDMDMVVRLCDRVAVIADGGILAEGRPLDILGDTAVTETAGLARPSFAPVIDWLNRVEMASRVPAAG